MLTKGNSEDFGKWDILCFMPFQLKKAFIGTFHIQIVEEICIQKGKTNFNNEYYDSISTKGLKLVSPIFINNKDWSIKKKLVWQSQNWWKYTIISNNHTN